MEISYVIAISWKFTVNGERFAELKHSRFQPYEIFRKNTFAVQWPPVFILRIAKNSRENFRDKLKNRENCECLAQRIFPHLRHIMI